MTLESVIGVPPFKTQELDWNQWEPVLKCKALEIKRKPEYRAKLKMDMSESIKNGLWDVEGIGKGLLPIQDHNRPTWYDPKNRAVYIPQGYRENGVIWKTRVNPNYILAMYYFTQEEAKRASGRGRSIMGVDTTETLGSSPYED